MTRRKKRKKEKGKIVQKFTFTTQKADRERDGRSKSRKEKVIFMMIPS
jgi:hypothetical protein